MCSPKFWIVSVTIFAGDEGSRRSAFIAIAEEPLSSALIRSIKSFRRASLPADVCVIETLITCELIYLSTLIRSRWKSSYLGSILRKFKCNALADTARTSSDYGYFAAKTRSALERHCAEGVNSRKALEPEKGSKKGAI